MILLIIYLLLLPVQDGVPMLTNDEFSYELEYTLEQKRQNTTTVYDIKEQSRSSTAMLPFVKIHFTFPEFRDSDKRIRVYQGDKVLNSKKIKGGMKMSKTPSDTRDTPCRDACAPLAQ